MKIDLVDDAGWILRRAWSVRLRVAGLAIEGGNIFLQAYGYLLPIPPVALTVLGALFLAASLVATFIKQKRD